jgi:hypothetical protein
LKNDSSWLEWNLDLLGSVLLPSEDLLNVGFLDIELVAVTDRRLQQHTNGVRELLCRKRERKRNKQNNYLKTSSNHKIGFPIMLCNLLTKTCIIEIWETVVIVAFAFNLELLVIICVGVVQRRELLTEFVSESVHSSGLYFPTRLISFF